MRITDLGRAGEGVGRSQQGLVLFIEGGATLGDEVLVEVPPGRRNMARLAAFELVERSPYRVEPPCPFYGSCGGCSLQQLDYAAELRWKAERVANVLRRIGGLDVATPPIAGASDPYGYRYKAAMPTDGPPLRLGFYARGSHRVVASPDCLVAAAPLRQALIAIERILRDAGLTADDVLHVVARLSRRHGTLIGTLVVRRADVLTQRLVERLMAEVPNLASLWGSVKQTAGNRIYGERFLHLAGQRVIEDELMGRVFQLGPQDFFQVHPAMAERLFGDLVDALMPTERLLDAYSGVGVLALLAAEKAAEVVGIEVVPSSVASAYANARRNGIRNVRFEVGSVEALLPRLGRFPVAILDPPRKGAPGLAPRLVAAEVRECFYVSCDPATLARDAAELAAAGFWLSGLRAYDMFPRTPHVEVLASFRRESSG